MAKVKELWIYPIKGCRGVQVPFLPINTFGPHLDRHWMLVDEAGRFLTQREEPRLALIEVLVDTKNWSLETKFIQVKVENDVFDLKLDLQLDRDLQSVIIWGQQIIAMAVAEDLSLRISDFLQRKVSLVQVHQNTQRSVTKKYQDIDALTAFADGYPLLAVFSASLDDLNSRLADKISFDRFRANVVIDNPGDAPFAEEQFKFLSVGHYEFTVKPCSRCVVINTNQFTGERQKTGEPLKVLAKYRNANGKVNFGINLVHKTKGILQVGDDVIYP